MSVYGKTKQELLDEENNLSFKTFTYQDAGKLFDFIRSKMDEPKEGFKPMGVEITMNGIIAYSYYQYGSVKNTIAWIKGKRKSVEYFGLSSACLDVWAKDFGEENFCAKYGIDSREYRLCGGSFPIIIKGVGMIGTVTVTGLSRQEDHQLCVEGLQSIKLYEESVSKYN